MKTALLESSAMLDYWHTAHIRFGTSAKVANEALLRRSAYDPKWGDSNDCTRRDSDPISIPDKFCSVPASDT